MQAWSPWTAQEKEVLEKVQQRAVSMISGLKAKEYEQKLKELEMTTLEEGHHQADMAWSTRSSLVRTRWILLSGSPWQGKRSELPGQQRTH